MGKEEEKLKKENEDRDKAEEEKLKADEYDLAPEQRYKKLCSLLNKSKFYSNFLLEKMEKEDEESKKLKSKNLAGRTASKDSENLKESQTKSKRMRSKEIEEAS